MVQGGLDLVEEDDGARCDDARQDSSSTAARFPVPGLPLVRLRFVLLSVGEVFVEGVNADVWEDVFVEFEAVGGWDVDDVAVFDHDVLGEVVFFDVFFHVETAVVHGAVDEAGVAGFRVVCVRVVGVEADGFDGDVIAAVEAVAGGCGRAAQLGGLEDVAVLDVGGLAGGRTGIPCRLSV